MLAKPDIGAGRITAPADMLTYVLAGNSTFTLRGKKDRFTYRVRKSEDGNVWFVQVLGGPDNTTDYVYLGVIRQGEDFDVTKKSQHLIGAPSVKAFAWFYARLRRPKTWDSLGPLEFWHEGRCGRCGRLLTVPASVERGIGPECAQIMECV